VSPDVTKRRRRWRAATESATWALSGPRGTLADSFGVSPSRIGHWKADDPSNPVVAYHAAILGVDNDDQARRLTQAAEYSWLRRAFVEEPSARLLARAAYLWARLIEVEAVRDRLVVEFAAGQGSQDYRDALRDHAAFTGELAALIGELEARHDMDVRGVLGL